MMIIIKLFTYKTMNKHTSHNHSKSDGVSGRPEEKTEEV